MASPRVRASVVCWRGDQLLTVCAVDPVGGATYLFLPGGKIEPGESPAAAAVRETAEETGYAIEVTGDAHIAEYQFLWAGKNYDCLTFFFRGRLIDPLRPALEVNDDAYLKGVEWVCGDQVESAFAYHEVILNAIQKLSPK